MPAFLARIASWFGALIVDKVIAFFAKKIPEWIARWKVYREMKKKHEADIKAADKYNQVINKPGVTKDETIQSTLDVLNGPDSQ